MPPNGKSHSCKHYVIKINTYILKEVFFLTFWRMFSDPDTIQSDLSQIKVIVCFHNLPVNWTAEKNHLLYTVCFAFSTAVGPTLC